MVTCCVPGCKNRSQKGLKRLTFHCFPKSKEQKETWAKAIGRRGWEPSSFSRICSIHFKDDEFDRTGHNTKLKESSIPSLELDNKVIILPKKTPRPIVAQLKKRIDLLQIKVGTLQQKCRRQNKRIIKLTEIVHHLQMRGKSLLESLQTLSSLNDTNRNLLSKHIVSALEKKEAT